MKADTTSTSDSASLDHLHDIITPDPVAWWPLAPAWYVVLGVLLIWLAWQISKVLGRYRANAYRREALRCLTDVDTAGALSALLKRVALAAYPREQVATLSGDAWLAFLDRTGGTNTFTEGPGKVLATAAYRQPQVDNWQSAVDAARAWINQHKTEATPSS